MTLHEKAYIILQHLNGGMPHELTPKKEKALMRIMDALDEIEEKEPTRTLSEVQSILDCVRAGIPAAVDYVDADELADDPDGLITRACW